MLARDLYNTWTNEDYSTNQKLASSAISVGGTAIRTGMGILAIAGLNAWNPIGWFGMALGVASVVVINLVTDDAVSRVEDGLQERVDNW